MKNESVIIWKWKWQWQWNNEMTNNEENEENEMTKKMW